MKADTPKLDCWL